MEKAKETIGLTDEEKLELKAIRNDPSYRAYVKKEREKYREKQKLYVARSKAKKARELGF